MHCNMMIALLAKIKQLALYRFYVTPFYLSKKLIFFKRFCVLKSLFPPNVERAVVELSSDSFINSHRRIRHCHIITGILRVAVTLFQSWQRSCLQVIFLPVNLLFFNSIFTVHLQGNRSAVLCQKIPF